MIEDGAIEFIEKATEKACDTGAQTASAVMLVSIAISLKRIADALTYQAAGPENLFDIVNDIRHNFRPTQR